jgi:hypothetical protein
MLGVAILGLEGLISVVGIGEVIGIVDCELWAPAAAKRRFLSRRIASREGAGEALLEPTTEPGTADAGGTKPPSLDLAVSTASWPSAGTVGGVGESMTCSTTIEGPCPVISPASSKAAVRGVICKDPNSPARGEVVRGGEPGTLKLSFWSRGVGGALLDLFVMKLSPFRAMGFNTGVVVSDLVPPPTPEWFPGGSARGA